MVYVFAVISIVLAAYGQFALKVGTGQVKSNGGLIRMFMDMAGNINVIMALACFVVSMAIWVFVLRKLELSIAYPMVSLGYVVVFALSFFLLHEPFTLPKLLGTGLIVLGVIVLNIR